MEHSAQQLALQRVVLLPLLANAVEGYIASFSILILRLAVECARTGQANTLQYHARSYDTFKNVLLLEKFKNL